MAAVYFLLAGLPQSGNLPVLFLLSSQKSTFSPLAEKNYELDPKMDDTFYDGHDELYHHAKFGKDRTTRAGCMVRKCGVFLVTLRFRYLLT